MGDLGATTLDLLLKLVLVVGLIYGLAWLTRRGQREALGGGDAGLNVVAGLALAPGISLKVVEIGDRALVLAVTRDRVWKLDEVADAEALSRLRSGTAATPTSPFLARLRELMAHRR